MVNEGDSLGDSERTATVHHRVELFGYRVEIAPWLLDECGRQVREAAPAHTIAVITDDGVAPFHAAHVVGSLRHFSQASRILYKAIASGEAQKSRDSWSALTDWLLGERCGRDTTVVALGGGVVGDLAGFVAATFMRGVSFVQIPTSLLAMVDASVGGKVGVDTPAGKNLVGAFHQPARVLIDPVVLQTLPLAHLRAGLAEVFKHGIIADASYLDSAVSLGTQLIDSARDRDRTDVSTPAIEWNGAPLASLIARSVEIKAAVVTQDEREGGIRRILNFGHTIGHAIEAASHFQFLHGEAVAIGMALEGDLAEQLGVASVGTADKIRDSLGAVGLPSDLPSAYTAEALLALMHMDKKAQRGEIVFALPSRIGAMAGEDSHYGIAVSENDILRALRHSTGTPTSLPDPKTS